MAEGLIFWRARGSIVRIFGLKMGQPSRRGKSVKADIDWYGKEMSRRIKEVDWDKAKADVQRFLRPVDVKTLELWNKKFFLDCLNRVLHER
ncbi:MAG: hypothetical protein HQ462_11325 [Deltaproteobacteria bacterium]|nr:hypothetical protein [Deltaproteobacteria bacterium]